RFGGPTEVEPGMERRRVRRLDLFVATELLGDTLDGRLDRPGVHERHEPQREEVLRAFGVARLHTERRAELHGETGQRHPQGQVYVNDTSGSAKKFFERSASRGFTPSGAQTSLVRLVIGTRRTR